MKPRKPFLKFNLFACLLAFSVIASFAGIIRRESKTSPTVPEPVAVEKPRSNGIISSDETKSLPEAYILPGDVFPMKKLIEDCDTLPRGEASLLCYDRTTKYLFMVTSRKVIREVTAPPSSRDVIVQRSDSHGTITRRLAPTYSTGGYCDVLDTYYDATGKRADVPVPMERPKIFDAKKAPKIDFEKMRQY